MEQSELLRFVVGVLEHLGIRYFVTGSVATVLYGEPRFTNDIDIVAELPAGRATAFCRLFPEPEYYVSDEAVRQAIASRSQFNIIHPASGLKIDVIIPADTAYDRGRFARTKRIGQVGDIDVNFSSPEDVVIKKMQAFAEGNSEKHLRDIAGVLKISGDTLDKAYIAEWASKLGVLEIWDNLLKRSDKL